MGVKIDFIEHRNGGKILLIPPRDSEGTTYAVLYAPDSACEEHRYSFLGPVFSEHVEEMVKRSGGSFEIENTDPSILVRLSGVCGSMHRSTRTLDTWSTTGAMPDGYREGTEMISELYGPHPITQVIGKEAHSLFDRYIHLARRQGANV